MAAALERNYVVHFPGGVKNVLVVANDMQDPSALAAALARMHARESVRIYLLAVQLPPSGYARSFLRAVAFRKVLRERGLQALRPLRELLDAAGVPYMHHVEVGPWLESISHFARERGCRRILVGDNQHSMPRNLLLLHDRRKIQSSVARSGFECAVGQLEEARSRPRPRIGQEARSRN